jgi:Acetyltransferase (GNAT) domain
VTARRSGRKLEVVELGSDSLDAWTAFVRESPHGSPYSTPAYLEALCTAAGGRYAVLAASRGDELVGGIAVYERSSPAGSYVSPRTLLFYNGIVLREYATKYPSESTARHAEVVGALAEALGSRGYGRVELRCRGVFVDARPLLERGWNVAPTYTYSIPLDDLEEQWTHAEQNFRRLVQRGREGLTLGVDEDFASFYRLHRLTAERKGAPLYLEESAFTAYYERLRAADLCHLYHALLPDGAVAASQLVLCGHAVTHTVAAAADPEHTRTGANAFLRWTAAEDLAARGHTSNDLTDATLASVAHFKSQMGSRLELCLVADRTYSRVFGAQLAAYRGLASARARRGRTSSSD